MKISAQMAQMMQGQDLKTLGGQALVELFSLLKEGDLKANVAQIVGKLITLEILGENLTIQLNVDENALQNLSMGSEVKLMLSDQGKIILEAQPSSVNLPEGQPPLPSSPILETNLESKPMLGQLTKSELDTVVSGLILKHNLANDPLTRELLSTLVKKDLPISGEMIKEIKHSLQALNIVAQTINETTLPIVAEKMQVDLKQLAVQLLGQAELSNASVENQLPKFENTSLEPVFNVLFKESQIQGKLIQSELDAFKSLLLEVKPEQLIQILSSKEAISFKDVVLLMNQLNQLWPEQESFNKISNFLRDVAILPKDVVGLFDLMASPMKADEKIEALETWLTNLKLTPLEEKTIKTEMAFLKESLALSNKNTDEIYVFQMPIKLNQEQNHVEFFIKRNKRKKEKQEAFQIYLTLSTKHYEKVSCLISGNSMDVNLKFGLENKDYVDVFSKQEAVLNTLVSSVTLKKINFSFEVREAVESKFFQNEDQKMDPYGIDIRV